MDNHHWSFSIFIAGWRPYLWLAGVGALLYVHVLTFSEYTYFDDYILIARSFSHIDELSDIGQAFLEDAGHQGQGGNLYRPILTVSFILSAQISGMELFGYHLLDILLHIAATLLLFLTLTTLEFRRSLSFVASLAFCVHPALTQAVAWISGRNDSLLAIFILSSFIAFVRFLSSSSLRWYVVHLLLFALAIFTKETAIAFPVLGIVYMVIKKEKLFTLKTLLLVVGWLIVAVNWQIMRFIGQVAPLGDKTQAVKTILSNAWISLSYLGNIVWPFQLGFAPVAADLNIMAGVLVLVLLSVAIAFSERKDWGMIAFGLLWFELFLVPTFFHFTNMPSLPKFYEHRVYIPFIGLLFIILSLSFRQRWKAPTSVALFITFVLIGALAALSFRHSFHFQNSLTLREYAADSSPNDLSQYAKIERMHVTEALTARIRNMRDVEKDTAELQGGLNSSVREQEVKLLASQLEAELNRKGNDPEFLHTIAIVQFGRGLLVKSESSFLRLIALQPENADARYNLGILYYEAHIPEKAKTEWEGALKRQPSMADAHYNLCFLYYELKQFDTAWKHCEEALRLGANISDDLVREIRGKKGK